MYKIKLKKKGLTRKKFVKWKPKKTLQRKLESLKEKAFKINF
jgi:hypothetical protein